MKLQTLVDAGQSLTKIRPEDGIMLLGSCFSGSIGAIMADCGCNVTVNPFGPLYNPISIANAVERMQSGNPFTQDECVQMGAGSSLWCSYSHYTKHARPTAQSFLADANEGLTKASQAWNAATTVIVTMGTAFVFALASNGQVVANCLKRDAKEFVRRRISVDEAADALERVVAAGAGKRFIFTVSPIRHMADGAHGNQVSKSTLLLAVERVCAKHPDACCYFPAYEIVMDELRDYRFYAEDMVHPSDVAVNYVWERFRDWCIPAEYHEKMNAARKLSRQRSHISINEY